MLDHLSAKLTRILKQIRGQGRLSEENIAGALREVRIALLEADVALPVVKQFIQQTRERALGREVRTSLTPGQALIKIVHTELVALMGGQRQELNTNAAPPVVILVAGLQGAGKTTTVAKLGCWIKREQKKSVMVTSADIHRPAAIDQLRILAQDNDLLWHQADAAKEPAAIAQEAMQCAGNQSADVLIVDTAGRLHVDEGMMREIQDVQKQAQPVETLFVVDSMMGQDAVNAAAAFDAALRLTGIVLTKTDSDTRGGAALTACKITGRPIKFLGTGEKADALIPFHPDRIASRILGMGDVLSLIEELEQKTDAGKTAKRVKQRSGGGKFNLTDFREHIDQISNMGGAASVFEKLPGMGPLPGGARVDDSQLIKLAAIIDSMTPLERQRPAIINGSRKRRIANGSGTQIQDVNRLLKQFTQMQKMMKHVTKRGTMAKRLRDLGELMPPGMKS